MLKERIRPGVRPTPVAIVSRAVGAWLDGQGRKTMLRMIAVSIVVALALTTFTTPRVAHAWNIICGVSIDLGSVEISAIKWDADSRALRAIALFYSAVAELQRIEIRDAERAIVPQSLWHPEYTATAEATRLLAESASEIGQSLTLMEQLNLGDDTGRYLLRSLEENIRAAYHSIDGENGVPTLPSLELLHNTANIVDSYVEHGIASSLEHLEMGLEGHGAGAIPLSLQ